MDNSFDISAEQFEEIEQYLMGKMAPKQKAEFEIRMEKEPALRMATEREQQLIIGVQEFFVKEQMEKYHTEMNLQNISPKTVPPLLPVPWKKYAVAAVTIGLVLLAAWWAFFKPGFEESIFIKYYEPDAGLITAMSTSENYTFQKAMVEYKNREYEKAITAWKSIAETDNSDTLRYFLGSAYLASRQASKAIPYFENVFADTASSFRADAGWYLGLSHLQNGDKEKAIMIFREVDHPQIPGILSSLKAHE